MTCYVLIRRTENEILSLSLSLVRGTSRFSIHLSKTILWEFNAVEELKPNDKFVTIGMNRKLSPKRRIKYRRLICIPLSRFARRIESHVACITADDLERYRIQFDQIHSKSIPICQFVLETTALDARNFINGIRLPLPCFHSLRVAILSAFPRVFQPSSFINQFSKINIVQ